MSCFPSTRNLMLFQEVSNVTITGLSFLSFLLRQHPGTEFAAWEDRGMLWAPLSFARSTVTLSPPCHLGWHQSDTNSNP